MQTFKINPDGFKEIRKQILIKTLPILLIAVTAGIIISSLNETHTKDDIYNWLIVIPIVGIAVGFGLVRGINRQKTIFESYTLIVEGNLIKREQFNSQTISIYFNDISDIIKNKNGSFTIKGKSEKGIISIPEQIDNYSDLENSLSQIMPITQKTKGSFRQIYSGALAILAVGLMACVYILSNRLIVGAAGIILIALLLWSFIAIRKNKNIDAKTKTSSWLVFIVIITVVVIMFQKITN